MICKFISFFLPHVSCGIGHAGGTLAGRGTSPARGAASLASLKTAVAVGAVGGCESHWNIRVSGNMIFHIIPYYIWVTGWCSF